VIIINYLTEIFLIARQKKRLPKVSKIKSMKFYLLIILLMMKKNQIQRQEWLLHEEENVSEPLYISPDD